MTRREFAIYVIFCVTAFAVMSMWFRIEERQAWDRYRARYNCKPIDRIPRDPFNTVPVVPHPNDRIRWQCNNGEVIEQ